MHVCVWVRGGGGGCGTRWRMGRSLSLLVCSTTTPKMSDVSGGALLLLLNVWCLFECASVLCDCTQDVKRVRWHPATTLYMYIINCCELVLVHYIDSAPVPLVHVDLEGILGFPCTCTPLAGTYMYMYY